jgi:hypothetical protein
MMLQSPRYVYVKGMRRRVPRGTRWSRYVYVNNEMAKGIYGWDGKHA